MQCDGYDVAQVCLNGHEANATFTRMPENNKSYCDKCGEKTITECPACNKPIRGYFWGSLSTGPYDVPHHCIQCGKPYPWTERRKAAALELFAELLHMGKEHQEELSRDLDAVAVDVPRTKPAALKIGTMIAKAGKESADMLRGVLVEIVSESAVLPHF
jgi:hypothetical protein